MRKGFVAAAIAAAALSIITQTVCAEVIIHDNTASGDGSAAYSAQEGIGEEKVTAEDGTVFLLTYHAGEDSVYVFDGYEIISPAVPENGDDFPEDSLFCSAEDIAIGENEQLVCYDFNVRFDVSEGVTSIEGTKFYIIDRENRDVRYVGADVVMEEIVPQDELENESDYDVNVPIEAEDGTKGYALIYDDGSPAGYELELSEPENELDFPELNGGTGEYYSKAEDIPLGKNEQLAEIDFSISCDDGSVVCGRKFYVIFADRDHPENSFIRYAGHDITDRYAPSVRENSDTEEGGYTHAPDTGNASLALSAAVISLAAMTVSGRQKNRKKSEKSLDKYSRV